MELTKEIFTKGLKLYKLKMYGETLLHIYKLDGLYYAIYTNHTSSDILKYEIIDEQKIELYIKMYQK